MDVLVNLDYLGMAEVTAVEICRVLVSYSTKLANSAFTILVLVALNLFSAKLFGKLNSGCQLLK